jgi:two-component system nitrogen regulation response regulator GlnG
VREADTLGTESEGPRPLRRPVELACATVLYHPDPTRVGARALILAQESGSPVLLSRQDLVFTSAHHVRSTLDDPHLSRAPIEMEAHETGLSLQVPARARACIDAEPVEGALRIERARLERGVVLELKRRVLLYLHLAEVGPAGPMHGLSGDGAAIRAVARAIDRVADLDVPVLVRGETGSGKERVAQAIHRASGRRGPCIAVNVATLSRELAGAELFGHAKGAFTGASERREGLFAQAHGGTLFLDEIGELPEDVQPMLLRVLETARIRPIGEREERAVDVRIVTATDADLERSMQEGRFRAALYHRLRGFEIRVPALRERREDVPAIVMELLREELAKTGELQRLERRDPSAPPWMERARMIELVRHAWPGNVRQLRGVLRQMVVSSRGEPTLDLDPAMLRDADEPATRPRGELGRAEILAALHANDFSYASAARALGISRAALYRRVEADPALQPTGELDAEALARCLREHEGDVGAAAAALKMSVRALKLRLRSLGLA